MVLETDRTHPHAPMRRDFDALFTPDRVVHFDYYGYGAELKGLLFGRPQVSRITVEGYREEGWTMAPFDMMLLNHVSRYHVMEYALRGGAQVNGRVQVGLVSAVAEIKHRVQKAREYILAKGKDPEGTYDMPKLEGMKA